MIDIQSERTKKTAKIIIQYDDGTEKEVTRGVIITDSSDEDDVHHKLELEFANVSELEVANIIYGVTEMGIGMGLYDPEKIQGKEVE